MEVLEKFKNGKLGIDISNAEAHEIDALDDFFNDNKLTSPWSEYRPRYVKESYNENWIYIFYDENGLNAYREGGKKHMYANYEMLTIVEFLASIEQIPSFEIEEDELKEIFN